MKLNKNTVLAENDFGTTYECVFPKWIVRFTIYKTAQMPIKGWFWINDHYERAGEPRCIPPCRFKTFEELAEAWDRLVPTL
jgi:hypothetical protein